MLAPAATLALARDAPASACKVEGRGKMPLQANCIRVTRSGQGEADLHPQPGIRPEIWYDRMHGNAGSKRAAGCLLGTCSCLRQTHVHTGPG